MEYSIGKAIKDVNVSKLAKPFFLKGNDFFLQSFFIKKVKDRYDEGIKIKYLNLHEDNDLYTLINNNTIASLFVEKNIFVIRNFNSISLKIKNELMKSLVNIGDDMILIFVLDDYYSSGKFINELSKNCIVVDARTPFPNKIKEWVQYYLKTKNITIDSSFLNELILSYGDDISNIIGEIDKIHLYTNSSQIGYENKLLTNYNKRNTRPWHLLDALGMKNIKKSIEITDDLFLNGFNIVPLVIILTNFFRELIFFKHNNNNNNYNGLNKLVNNNMKKYSCQYKESELFSILNRLSAIDIYSKTTSLKHDELLVVYITQICNNYYE